MPETTFKKDAHTISNSLGNIFFFTNDECDECNTNFGSGIVFRFTELSPPNMKVIRISRPRPVRLGLMLTKKQIKFALKY
jgi:hypothetical protein